MIFEVWTETLKMKNSLSIYSLSSTDWESKYKSHLCEDSRRFTNFKYLSNCVESSFAIHIGGRSLREEQSNSWNAAAILKARKNYHEEERKRDENSSFMVSLANYHCWWI